MKVEKLDDEEEIEAEDVMDVIKATMTTYE